MARCCRCVTAPTTRIRSTNGRALGGRTFAHEARLRDEGKEAVVLTFPAPLDKDATNALRAAGFRFSKIMRHWEGLALYDAAAEPRHGAWRYCRRVAAASPPTPASVPAGSGDDRARGR